MAKVRKERTSSIYEKAPDRFNANSNSTGYKPSNAVNTAKQAYTVHNSKKPSAYTGKYDNLINDNLNNILNRKQFSYDASKDALYNQYKDMYTRNGQTAMQDTMGNAALLTGGKRRLRQQLCYNGRTAGIQQLYATA